MGCQQIDEMMSLKLDGLLTAEEDLQFHEHIAGCTLCRATWEAMQLADSLLCASSLEPLPVPLGFTAKVMQRVAVTAAERPVAVPVAGPTVVLPSVLPPHYAQAGDGFFIPDLNLQEWQHRLGGYLRGVAAVGLSLAASLGVLLALLVSGALEPGASASPLVETLRTFFSSLTVWATSLASGFGTQIVAVVGVVLALMALAAWQIVNSYHRAAEVPYDATGEVAA